MARTPKRNLTIPDVTMAQLATIGAREGLSSISATIRWLAAHESRAIHEGSLARRPEKSAKKSVKTP